MSAEKFLEGAPKFITNRYQSINKYVWETLFPKAQRDERISKLPNKEARQKEATRQKEIVNEASLLVFIFLLKRTFEQGSEAAKNAVDTFKDLKVDGFYIGNKLFKDRNDNVILGDVIATKLLENIQDDKVKSIIEKSRHVWQILEEYKRLVL